MLRVLTYADGSEAVCTSISVVAGPNLGIHELSLSLSEKRVWNGAVILFYK